MSHVVPDLVQKVLKGQDPLHVLGDGDQVRHYTYGGDLARGIVDAHGVRDGAQRRLQPVHRRVDHGARAGPRIWRKVHGEDRPFSVVHDAPFEHDVQRRVPAVDKARDVLGFEATTTLDTMLDVVIPWVRRALADGIL